MNLSDLTGPGRGSETRAFIKIQRVRVLVSEMDMLHSDWTFYPFKWSSQDWSPNIWSLFMTCTSSINMKTGCVTGWSFTGVKFHCFHDNRTVDGSVVSTCTSLVQETAVHYTQVTSHAVIDDTSVNSAYLHGMFLDCWGNCGYTHFSSGESECPECFSECKNWNLLPCWFCEGTKCKQGLRYILSRCCWSVNTSVPATTSEPRDVYMGASVVRDCNNSRLPL